MNKRNGATRLFDYLDVAGVPGRFPVLDALRAVAIVLVLLRHWVRPAGEHFGLAPDHPFQIFALNGWIGVDLFFVLSGFLIASTFTGAQAQALNKASLLQFYRRRALRTMPLYWGVILLCWIAAPWTGAPGWSTESFRVHLLFLQDYLGSDVMVTLWSLAVEEKFYLVAPLLMLMLARAGRRLTALLLLMMMAAIVASMAGAAASMPGAGYSAWFWSMRAPFHHAVLAILVGVLVAIMHGAGRIAPAVRAWPFWSCCAVLCVLHIIVDWTSLPVWTWASMAIAVSACLFGALVVLGLSLNAARPAFGAWRPLRHIAKLSYALYLVHFPLVPIALASTHAALAATGLPASGALASGVFLFVYIGWSWLAALLLHYALEKPFLLLRERWPGQGRTSAVLAAAGQNRSLTTRQE